MGPALCLDRSDCRPLQEVDVKDLERRLGDRRHERLVLRYDWSEQWGQMRYYTSHPFLSEDAARWLVDHGVRLLAMDTPMPDDPRNGGK